MAFTRRAALISGLAATGIVPLRAATETNASSEDCDRVAPQWGQTDEGQRCADLRNGLYRNPILAGDHPDPSVLREGNSFYLVSSSFVYYPGLVIWRSGDLVNWSPVVPTLNEPLGSVYAPDLVKYRDRYYLYFAVRSIPQQPAPPGTEPRHPMTNYVMYAEHIEGPWSEPVNIGIYNAIDPGHAVDENGRRFVYVSDGNRIPLSEDGLSRDGPAQKLYDGWRYPADWAVETFALEGPKIIRRGSWFYLFSAEGGTAGPPTSHMVIVARATSLEGPWENSPYNPLIHTNFDAERWWSRGHGTPVEDLAGEWWIIYHAYENGFRTLGRQTLLEPLTWTADGWPRAKVGDPSKALRKPSGDGGGPHGVPFSSPYDERSFGACLTFFKPSRHYRDRVKFDQGALVLQAQGKDPTDASPLLLNVGDLRYEISVELELTGGVLGGLLLFYHEKLFCGIASDDSRFRAYVLGAETPFEARTAAIGRQFHLRLVNEHQVGRFFYSTDGHAWVLHRSYDVSGYHHNVAGGYLSLRPGIFAAGDGSLRIRSVKYHAE